MVIFRSYVNGYSYNQSPDAQIRRGTGDGGSDNYRLSTLAGTSNTQIGNATMITRSTISTMVGAGSGSSTSSSSSLMNRGNGNDNEPPPFIPPPPPPSHKSDVQNTNANNVLNCATGLNDIASSTSYVNQKISKSNFGQSASANVGFNTNQQAAQQSIGIPHKKTTKRHGPRRHTLQNGIDNTTVSFISPWN